MEDVVVPLIAITSIFIGLPWVILHYVTRWKTAPRITDEDERLLDEMYNLARRLEDRVTTVERIVAADNPDFRAERGVEIALHSNWVGIDACERAMLGQALHSHFGGGIDALPGLERIATGDRLHRAALWGLAIRLAQRLSGGVEGPLAVSRLARQDDCIDLSLRDDDADLYGEAVERRLRHLAQAMGLKYRMLDG